MKNLRSIVRSVLAAIVAAGFVMAPMAMASNGPEFNNLSNDLEFLQGRKVTDSGAFTDPVNSVNAGDEVYVAVYYHNTVVDSVARNTTIKITMPNGLESTHIIKGQLSADNADAVRGTISNGVEIGKPDLTVNTTTPTTMDYVPGSVRWYPERMPTEGPGANLPNGQNGDSIISSGINLGDLRGCFQYSGFVLFKVKVTGELIKPKAVLAISKEVRENGTENAYVQRNIVNPGDKVDYRITVRNIDGQGVALDVILKDLLPVGETVIGPVTIRKSNGETATLAGDITSPNGVVVFNKLQPNDFFQIFFTASTATTFLNNQCVTNTAGVEATNATNKPQSSADTCFVVTPPTPTPTPTVVPTPTPKPTPQPELPKTGPELNILAMTALGGLGLTTGRYAYLKNGLKKRLKNIDVA